MTDLKKADDLEDGDMLVQYHPDEVMPIHNPVIVKKCAEEKTAKSVGMALVLHYGYGYSTVWKFKAESKTFEELPDLSFRLE